MASKKYQGPYSAKPVLPAGWDVEEWQVVLTGTVNGQPAETAISPRTYRQRTAAVRRATTLNKQWIKKVGLVK